jgi:tetratricopeptide (TPR) repeat protein
MLGFFAGSVVLLLVLQRLPGIGGLFRGFFGFWLAAILFSILAERMASALAARQRFTRATADLGHVDSAYNQGKLGSLLVSAGKFKAAIEPLQRACAGEPESAEWAYRLGLALLASGRADEALEALQRSLALNSEHAYGEVHLALARAHLALRRDEAALATLAGYEREHGPSPESAYHRGVALRMGGDRAAARLAFREVGELAARAARFQRKAHSVWVWKAWLGRLA